MNIDWTISIGNILTIIFISVILWEVITARKSIEHGAWQDIVGKILELDRTVIDNSNLHNLLTEEDTGELSNAEELCVTSYLTCFEQLYMQKDIISKEEYWNHWKNYMRKLSSLPKFKKVWKGEKEEDFVESFRKEILNKEKDDKFSN